MESNPITILKLNDDCLEKIFSMCCIEDLVNVDQVCSRFRDVVEHFYKQQTKLILHGHMHPLDLMAALAERLGPYVTSLQLTNFGEEEDDFSCEFLAYFFSHFEKLEKLSVMCIDLMPHLQEMKRIFHTLKSATLVQCGLNDDIGECLAEATQLESLGLDGNQKIRGSFLPALKDQLIELNISNCFLVLGTISFHDFCDNNVILERLTILNYDCDDDFIDVGSFLRQISMLTNLKCLKLAGIEGEFYGRSIWFPRNQAALPNIEDLELNCEVLNDFSYFLDLLTSQNCLESLVIRCEKNYYLDRVLGQCTKLKNLQLYVREFGNQNLARINRDSRETLEDFHLNQADVTDLDLLSFIRQCPMLKILNLSSCKNLTDNFILSLIPITKRRPQTLEIYVRQDTKITPTMDQWLQHQGIQKIKLIHDSNLKL